MELWRCRARHILNATQSVVTSNSAFRIPNSALLYHIMISFSTLSGNDF